MPDVCLSICPSVCLCSSHTSLYVAGETCNMWTAIMVVVSSRCARYAKVRIHGGAKVIPEGLFL